MFLFVAGFMQSSLYRLRTPRSMTAVYVVTVTQLTILTDFATRAQRAGGNNLYLTRHRAAVSSICCGMTAVSVSDAPSGRGLP
jgi:hypothetical protein